MQHSLETLQAVAGCFQVPGQWQQATPYGSGHINDTYLVQWRDGARTLATIQQRINHEVFKQPVELMNNIARVTDHLRRKLNGRPGGDPQREVLTIIPARDGRLYHRDGHGHYWRMYVFVRDARSLDVCESPPQAYEAARAFGAFQAALADLPGGRLHETIPYFHHTPRRLQALEAAAAQDPCRRAAAARPEIEFCRQRRGLAATIVELLAGGRLPERVTHNDTKINNVMMDERTGRGVCVIDLDTVMSGCALYDFGDMARTMPRTAAEDERDLDRVRLDMAVFEALVRGYLESAGRLLTPLEIENLPLAGRLITLTIGMRFLSDYLLGDVYFKTSRPGQNLDRARVQFKITAEMERQAEAIGALVRRYAEAGG